MRKSHWMSALVGVVLLILTGSGTAAPALVGDSAAARDLARETILSTAHYKIPLVRLTREDGKSILLPEEMNDGRPVVLNFIFTSCSSVCPLMSEVFSQFARKLGTERDKVHMMSISIDPEEDTPARLREYAHKFKAGPEWQHYTGTVEASVAAQRAFGAYYGDKMTHPAVTLLRAAPDTPWVRLDGFVTPDELLEKYRQMLQQHTQALATR